MKKGFTLVEVLGVIVILAIILMLVVPNLLGVVGKSKDDTYEIQVENVLAAAKVYVLENYKSLPDLNEGGSGIDFISISELITLGYLEDEVTNPKTNQPFDSAQISVKITRLSNDNFTYEFVDGFVTGATFAVNPTALVNTDVTVTITYDPEIVTKEYKIDSGSWNSYTGPVTMTNNGFIYARGYDASSNESDVTSILVNNIDKDSPALPVLVSDTEAYTNGNVNINIAYSSDSVLKEYKIDSGSWMSYSTAIPIGSAGTVVYARARDEAQNYSAEASITVDNIDKVDPVIDSGVTSCGGSFTGTASCQVFATDALSGLEKLEFNWDASTTTPTGGWSEFTSGESINSYELGDYYLHIKATDKAGNSVTSRSGLFSVTELVNETFIASITTSGYQTYTIPYDGTYRITTEGAGCGSYGGAFMEGDFSLTAGDELLLMVGKACIEEWGGAGGTFVAKVVTSSSYQTYLGDYVIPLIVSGAASGNAAGLSDIGTSGAGGDGTGGGGGGGFATDGVDNTAPGGKSFLNGGAGGAGYQGGSAGSYGGGGGEDDDGGGTADDGGGSGGYDGGIGVSNSPGTPGNSYNDGTNQSNVTGGAIPGADGYINIELIGA